MPIEDAVSKIDHLGKGTMLVDLESAYHMVPVHPKDRLLLCVSGNYVDGVLSFGLRWAPKLFTLVSYALLWIMGRHGVLCVIILNPKCLDSTVRRLQRNNVAD